MQFRYSFACVLMISPALRWHCKMNSTDLLGLGIFTGNGIFM